MLHYCCTSTRFETIRVVRADSLYSLHWPNSAGGVPVATGAPRRGCAAPRQLLACHFFVPRHDPPDVPRLVLRLASFRVPRLALDPVTTSLAELRRWSSCGQWRRSGGAMLPLGSSAARQLGSSAARQLGSSAARSSFLRLARHFFVSRRFAFLVSPSIL